MIVHLSNVKHLDISNDDNKEMSFVLLEILKETSNVSSINTVPNTFELLFSNDDLQKYLNKMIEK